MVRETTDPSELMLSKLIYHFSGSGKLILKNRDSCQTHGKGDVFEPACVKKTKCQKLLNKG